MDYATVCSGIEAPSVALGRPGWQAAWFSEIDPFPCKLLAHHYPETPNLGDMTGIAKMVRAGDVPAPAVLIGGTPCQAFSVAGLRNGLSDERGALTISFVEIADAVDSIRQSSGQPESVVWWENEPGVLTSKDNAFGCFLGALAGESCELQPAGKRWNNAGCVYGPQRAVAWRVLDAQHFGLAQRRKRLFVIASARAGFDPAKVLFEFDGVRRDSEPWVEYDETEHPPATYGRPFDMLGFGQYGRGLKSSTSKARDYKDATDLVVMPDGRVRRLTPVECERLMGFPDGYTAIPWRDKPATECPDGPRYKAIGNSMATTVIRWIGSRIQNYTERMNMETNQ